jgi:hypothetical protein
MKLSKQDIGSIKAFVSKRGFTEPDLQMEIIDHVACHVEDLMEANAQLTLNDAISRVHAGFGAMGFSVFEDGMRSSLQRRYWHLFRQNLVAAINLKTIPLLLGTGYLLYIIFNGVRQPAFMFGATFILMLLVLVLNGFVNEFKFKRYNRMLTFRMGNAYLLMSSGAFQLYNVLFVQLKLYQRINEYYTGALWAAVILLVALMFYAVRQTQYHAVEVCRKLEEKYILANS